MELASASPDDLRRRIVYLEEELEQTKAEVSAVPEEGLLVLIPSYIGGEFYNQHSDAFHIPTLRDLVKHSALPHVKYNYTGCDGYYIMGASQQGKRVRQGSASQSLLCNA